MDYTIIFVRIDGDDETNVVDSFVASFDASDETVSRVAEQMWFIAPGISFSRRMAEAEPGDDGFPDGPHLETAGFRSDDLHRLLAAFFGYLGRDRGYAAIGALGEDAAEGIAMIGNDPDLDDDPLGAETGGIMRSYRAGAVLGSAALFASFGDQMFGADAQDAIEDAIGGDGEEVETDNTAGWLFADIQGDIDEPDDVVIFLGGDKLTPQRVLRDALGLPSYTVTAGDHFSWEDERTGAIVTVQPFPTGDGPYMEVRLILPTADAASVAVPRMAQQARVQGIHEVLRVIDYDDYLGTVNTAPIREDGTEGPLRTLTMAF